VYCTIYRSVVVYLDQWTPLVEIEGEDDEEDDLQDEGGPRHGVQGGRRFLTQTRF
jgi:hypothetical protein